MTHRLLAPTDRDKDPALTIPSGEWWDLYDRNGTSLGRTIRRGNQLAVGEYHLVVQVWVRNPQGAYLIQKRADTGIWATTAGCVIAGETSRSGAVRELAEELGIVAAPHEIHQIYQDMSQYALGTAWVLERAIADDAIVIQAEEVSATMWANRQLIEQMVVHGLFYDYGEQYFAHVFAHHTAIDADDSIRLPW